jgi:DNA-binding IclR family transcriptional regulator
MTGVALASRRSETIGTPAVAGSRPLAAPAGNGDAILVIGGRRDPSSSVGKALRLLRALAVTEGAEAGVSELAAKTALPKSTAHRVLAELILEGFVSHSGNRYRLGPGWYALQWKQTTSEWTEVISEAQRPLSELFEATGATVHLAVLDHGEVLYLEKLMAGGGTRICTRVGARMPPTCTALGKVLLAHSDEHVIQTALSKTLPRRSPRSIVAPGLLRKQLDDIRTTGVAFDYEESQIGVFCVAAAVIRDQRPVVAVSVARPGTPAWLERDAALTADAARKLAARLTHA